MKERGRPFTYPCRWLILSCFLFSLISVHAQNYGCRKVPSNQVIRLDSIAIEPGSIQVNGEFEYNEQDQTIKISSNMDSVRVCYRVLSESLVKGFQNRDISRYDASRVLEPILAQNTPVEKEELFEFEGVEKYGAITRGISFGNRQSVFVNSSLNLQMNGKVADNLNVSAVITDQNIPYQPEGNTQQIRDFDNVFINLYNDRFSAIAGDVVLRNPIKESYFLKYLKNVQGLQLSLNSTSGNWRSHSQVSGSISKGKFASIVIPAIEGVAGPYRLRGPNDERFIIILANSEKIFLDEKLMERGFNKDYVIDYNLGEIIFNNHIVITQFSRIRADFEYAEQFYSRSNLTASQSLENDRVKVYGSFYRAGDNPNNNFGFNFNESDLDQLESIGDQVNQAFVSGTVSSAFNKGSILYIRKDTIDLDGTLQQIFVFSADPEAELFSTTFSEVEMGEGDYVLDQTTSNGRIYTWISPENGVRRGNYQPGALVPLPNRRQMFSLGTEIKSGEYETIFFETALTQLDKNLYSSLDDSDNNGQGYYGGIRTIGRNTFIPGYKLTGTLRFEYDQANFSFIDRYRPIAFDRNWDINTDTVENRSDFLLWAEMSLTKNNSNEISYLMNQRSIDQTMNGWWHALNYDQSIGKFQLESTHSYRTNTQGMNGNSDWLLSRSDISFQGGHLVPGYIFEIDENELALGDSVVNTQNHFRSHEFYITNGDSTKGQFRGSYLIRDDKLPFEGQMRDYLASENISVSYLKQGGSNNISADLNYRFTENKLDPTIGRDELIAGRLNWHGNYLKRSLSQNLSFSTGNSRELRREFVYIPVSTGEGTHTWRDQNEDGIQDLNEFFEAINPDERNYVKIFTPTDEYITSFQTIYIHTIDVRTPGSWRRQGGFRSFVSKFSANINLNINYRTTSDSYNDRLNPFAIRLSDPMAQSVQDRKRYTLFFNRNRRGLAGDFAYQTSNNKQLLTQGFELRENQQWIYNAKLDLSDEYTFRMTTTLGQLLNSSDFLDSRNFEIASQSYKPQLIWLPSQRLRLIGSYEYKKSQNELLETSLESSTIQRYQGELTWNQIGKGSLRGVFSWVDINFAGDENTYLAYLLLDALRPGTNQTWQLNWQQKLSRGMQLSLLYNGRKSENAQAIHTGTVQVTAFF